MSVAGVCRLGRAHRKRRRQHRDCQEQQEAPPPAPDRSAWIGGHGTEPEEQNTQQSPGFGRSVAPHCAHV
jgi:hypothetical protein